MRIFGQFKIGAPVVQHTDVVRVDSHVAPEDAYIAKLSAYLDGQGAGGATQKARAVAYDRNNVLLASGSEVIVGTGAAPAWIDFPFANPPKVTKGQLVKIGLHYGDVGGTIRSYQLAAQGAGGEEMNPIASITASGNEITDATRLSNLSLGTTASGQMCDAAGLDFTTVPPTFTPDSSYGIHRAATNQFRRGQCDAVTDWNIFSTGVTRATDATTPPPFSTQSIKVIADGTAANQGIAPSSAAGQAAAVGTSEAGSIWFKGVSGQSYSCNMRWVNTDASTTDGASLAVTASGRWQLLSPAAVTVAAGKTGDALVVIARINGTRSETFWVAHAMLEKGQGAAAPYVATSGGATATHAAARVQIPSALLSATRGWFAVRRRMGIPSTGGGSQQNSVWWGTGSVYIGLYNSGPNFYMDNSDNSASAIQAYAAGDEITIVGYWTPTQVGLSINGGAFVTANTTTPPNPVAALFDVGRDTTTATNYMEGDAVWFACGTGTPTNADAAALHANGHTDPALDALPANATGMWSAKTAVFETFVPSVETSGTYAGGAPATLVSTETLSNQRSLFATYVKAWTLPDDVDDFYIARLPWETSQSVMGNGGVLTLPVFHADVGWHGTDLDDEEGAFAIVKEGSVLEALIGERIRVRTDRLSPGVVFAFVHNRYPIVDDVSLTRRAFLELSNLAADNVRCVIEVMG